MAVSRELSLPWAPGHRLKGGRGQNGEKTSPTTAAEQCPHSRSTYSEPEGLCETDGPEKGQVRVQERAT
jgi:hypothetical protein